jgi:hypothetical protein
MSHHSVGGRPQIRHRSAATIAAFVALALQAGAVLAQGDPAVGEKTQVPVDSSYSVRILDRPTSLPAGDVRFDAFTFFTRAPGASNTLTAVLGGGVGITNELEVGGQIIPFNIEPGIAYTNPSLYATYIVNVGKVSLAPTLQSVLPLSSGDPLFIDIGGVAYVNIGQWGYISFAPTLSLNVRQEETGSSVSIPVTLLRQSSEQLTFQVSSGVGLSRFDPRFGVSRRQDALDFNDVTVPLIGIVTYTLPHGAPRRPLADLTLQVQWPQLYTHAPQITGTHANDWTVALQSSWYFLR